MKPTVRLELETGETPSGLELGELALYQESVSNVAHLVGCFDRVPWAAIFWPPSPTIATTTLALFLSSHA